MKWEQITAVISILISLISIGVTTYNSFKQRKIKEKLQDNEFEYSKRKIWYDKQSLAIDEMLEIISLINKQFNKFKESFNWDSDGVQEHLQFALKDSDKLRDIDLTKRVYLEESMTLLLKRYISILDEISDQSFEYVVKNNYNSLDKKWTISQIDKLTQIYDSLLFEINRKYLK